MKVQVTVFNLSISIIGQVATFVTYVTMGL